MTPERWQRVKTLYHAARLRPVAEWSAFLARECAGDTALQLDVEALLDQQVGTSDFVNFIGDPGTPLAVAGPNDVGASLVGRRLGTFEVHSLIGRGGMGEVYRAHDTRLGRDVAIKVLPRAFTAHTERVSSFEREARVVAALNHPHIAAIHGFEESAGIRGLVLELVEGQTLAEKIADAAGSSPRRLPLKDVLDIARQIADALEAAHEKGIIHRDLKPGNVKITSEGDVKLLDFGIAVMTADDALPHSGVIAGTAAYMSPEQARGKPVDKRTDIWAFGCVLYEMLSGTTAFRGDTLADTLEVVSERDPDWSALPADTPRALRHLVHRCLARNPRERLRDIGDARIEIEQIMRAPTEDLDADVALRQARTWRWRARLGLAVGAAAALATGVLAVMLLRGSAGPLDSKVVRFAVEVPEDSLLIPTMNSSLALSPDGRLLALTPLFGPVYIRRLDGLDNRPLDQVRGRFEFRGAPVFSPDSAFLSFIDGNGIISKNRRFLKVAVSNGAVTKLADYDNFHGGDWAADGWIYFTRSYPGGIVRIRDSGGAIEPVTELDVRNGERSHRFASLLPGDDVLLFTVAFDGITSYDDARIDLWDMRTRRRKTVISGGTAAQYSPSGHIVYARAGKLLAVPFDAARREVTGSPFEVVDGVMMSRNTGSAQFVVSKRGDLAYAPGAVEGGTRTLVWVDRSGKAEPLPLPSASYLYPRISPDGRSIALEIEGPNHDFYFYDFARTVLSKITTDGMSHNPVWSPDGGRLAFRSWQSGGMTMWSMKTDRSGTPARLDPSGTRQSPVAFSPDGKFLAFDQKDSETDDDAWILPLEGGPSRPIATSKAGEGSAKFSPDGRWIAYSSTESGKAEIYVQPFPAVGPKLQISNDGGTDPVWRRQGGELYYRSAQKMMVVSVDTTGPRLRASAPRMLFEGPYYEGTGASCEMGGPSAANYDVTADGRRFLMVRDPTDTVSGTHVVVVLNWAAEVKERRLR